MGNAVLVEDSRLFLVRENVDQSSAHVLGCAGVGQ